MSGPVSACPRCGLRREARTSAALCREPESGSVAYEHRGSAWIPHARRALHIHDTWGTPDDPDGKVRPITDYTELSARMANVLRATLAVAEQDDA